ncbi:MAG: hypothetical protein KDI13_10620 [Alphaproteobacteria bacterium]|nr:hypothetical protein [Alphaproteobacteria bacterium]
MNDMVGIQFERSVLKPAILICEKSVDLQSSLGRVTKNTVGKNWNVISLSDVKSIKESLLQNDVAILVFEHATQNVLNEFMSTSAERLDRTKIILLSNSQSLHADLNIPCSTDVICAYRLAIIKFTTDYLSERANTAATNDEINQPAIEIPLEHKLS